MTAVAMLKLVGDVDEKWNGFSIISEVREQDHVEDLPNLCS